MKIVNAIRNWLFMPLAYIAAIFLGLVIMLFSGEFNRNSLEMEADYEC